MGEKLIDTAVHGSDETRITQVRRSRVRVSGARGANDLVGIPQLNENKVAPGTYLIHREGQINPEHELLRVQKGKHYIDFSPEVYEPNHLGLDLTGEAFRRRVVAAIVG